MHPSYRDLLIEELMYDRQLRKLFMQNMTIPGIKLALSDTGGYEGQRFFPLMVDDEYWEILRERCIQLVDQINSFEIQSLLTILTNGITQSKSQKEIRELEKILINVLKQVFSKWNTTPSKLSPYDIDAYCKASLFIKPLPPIPDLIQTWQYYLDSFIKDLDEAESYVIIYAYSLEQIIDLITLIEDNEPRFLKQVGFPKLLQKEMGRLVKILEDEVGSEVLLSEYEEYKDEAERLAGFVTCCENLAELDFGYTVKFDELVTQLSDKVIYYDDKASELFHPDIEDEQDDFEHTSTTESFDIDAVFSDL